jgi:hypothetical protein
MRTEAQIVDELPENGERVNRIVDPEYRQDTGVYNFYIRKLRRYEIEMGRNLF